MGIRARRRAGVIVGLAGMLGGALVGLGSVDGAAQSGGTPGGSSQVAAATSPAVTGGSGSIRNIPPTQKGGGSTHSAGSMPTHSGGSMPTYSGGSTPTHGSGGTPSHGPGNTPPSTLRSIAGTASPGSSPASSPSSSPKGAPTAGPTGAPTSSPRARTSPTAGPSSGAHASPTPLPGSNNRNPNWSHDSQSWRQWDGAYHDPTWHREHSRDSRHEHGFFAGDRDRFCDRHDCDRFHFDEFRSEDRDFRHDCDVLLSFHSVRALLDYLDGDDSLRDFFELHGDLFDFLVHHSDEFDEFDGDCTFIIIHV